MVSKVVLDRQKVQEDQAAWVSTNATSLAAKLGKVIGKVESTEDLILALSRLVEKRAKAMAEADAAHTLELADDAAPRMARDTAAEAVAGELQFARSSISTIYGPRALVALGLADAISRDPAAIEATAKLFVKSVESPGFAMPTSKSPAATVDVAALAASVKSKVPPLTAALGQVSTEEAEAHATQQTKNAAVDAFESAFSPVNDVLYGLAVLAGARELGEKLPSLPRSKSRADDAEEPAPPTSTPPT